MPGNNPTNIELVECVAEAIEPLLGEIVLVGGCAVELLITAAAAPRPRAPLDVDAIIDIVTLTEYNRIEGRLKECGFVRDAVLEGPICRFYKGDLMLDLMTCDASVLGFGNRWYRRAFDEGVARRLPNGLSIRHVSAPCFLATKLVAFMDRGRGDLFGSKDFEDIVAVVDGRVELQAEFEAADAALRGYVAGELGRIAALPAFRDCLPGMIPQTDARAGRLDLLLQRFAHLANGSSDT